MAAADLHGPHLNHLPFNCPIFPALVWLGVPVTVQLQVEDIIVSLLVCSLSLFLPTCTTSDEQWLRCNIGASAMQGTTGAFPNM